MPALKFLKPAGLNGICLPGLPLPALKDL